MQLHKKKNFNKDNEIADRLLNSAKQIASLQVEYHKLLDKVDSYCTSLKVVSFTAKKAFENYKAKYEFSSDYDSEVWNNFVILYGQIYHLYTSLCEIVDRTPDNSVKLEESENCADCETENFEETNDKVQITPNCVAFKTNNKDQLNRLSMELIKYTRDSTKSLIVETDEGNLACKVFYSIKNIDSLQPLFDIYKNSFNKATPNDKPTKKYGIKITCTTLDNMTALTEVFVKYSEAYNSDIDIQMLFNVYAICITNITFGSAISNKIREIINDETWSAMIKCYEELP